MTTDADATRTGQPPVTFTIDGEEFSTDDRRQTAADLLALAKVDPENHDLAQIVGQGERREYDDSDEIQITPDAKFITIFTGPTPVV